jgi:hypothetical protein
MKLVAGRKKVSKRTTLIITVPLPKIAILGKVETVTPVKSTSSI